MRAVLPVLLALVLGSIVGIAPAGCKPKRPLAAAVFGTASISERKLSLDKKESFNDVIEPAKSELLSLHLEPPNTVTCMDPVDHLKATANGTPMKLEASGGSHEEHPMGPSHFPTKQVICDPIRFTLPRASIKPDADGVVTFEVTDGETTIKLAWAHLFDRRKVTLVDHAPSIKVGEHLKLAWSPADDKLDGTQVEVCASPSADTLGCPPNAHVRTCTPGRLTGSEIEFEVPARWTCMPSGLLWAANVRPQAMNRLCDARFKECRADLLPGTERPTVQITP